MDVPASMQDWWVYLLPGGYSLFQFLMLYDGLSHLLRFPHQFHIGMMLSVGQSYAIPLILVGATSSLLIGSFFESISPYLRYQPKNFFTLLNANTQLRNEKKALTTRPLLRKNLMPRNRSKPTESEIEEIMNYWETFVYERSRDRTIDTVQETQVAISFTDSFLLSFSTTVFSIIWADGRGYDLLAVLIALFMVVGVAYLLWNAKDLRETYWNKIIRAAFAACQQ